MPENANQQAGARCETCTAVPQGRLHGRDTGQLITGVTSSSQGAGSSHNPPMQSPPPRFTESHDESYPKALLWNSVMGELRPCWFFFMPTISFPQNGDNPMRNPTSCRCCNGASKYAGESKLVTSTDCRPGSCTFDHLCFFF